MSAAGSYPPSNVKTRRAASTDSVRHPDRSAASDPVIPEDGPTTAPDGDETDAGEARRSVDLSGLSIAGFTRRRVGWAAAGVVAAWIVVVFARQAGDASAASARAAQLAKDNTALAAEVQSLQHEVDLVVRPEYVSIAAHAHELGDPHEIPFTLSPSVAAPVDGAPGSASARLGARDDRQTPLESWLSLLFGPGA
jgi:cell division protein FtsB